MAIDGLLIVQKVVKVISEKMKESLDGRIGVQSGLL